MENSGQQNLKNKNKIFLDAPLIGGAFMAVLSSIPIINFFNILCCMWLVIGGVISYIYVNKKEEYIPRSSDGLIYGILSGIFGWIISLVLSLLMFSLKAGKIDLLKENLSRIGGPETDKIMQILDKVGLLGIFFIFNSLMIIFYLIFPTIGGAVAQAFSKKREVNIEQKTDESKI